MIEITNKQRYPVQLIVRSRRAINQFTVMDIPGVGKEKNKVIIEDDRYTQYIDRAEQAGLISTRILND
jgi:hypothetical protein